MDNSNKTMIQSTMEKGVIFGIALILMNLVLYFFNIKAFSFLGMAMMLLVQLLIYFFLIYYYTKKYKENNLEGYISFNQAFLYGLLLMFFSAIILSFFLFILNKFIDPDMAKKNIEQAKEWATTFMQNHGIAEDKIDDAIKKFDSNGIPSPMQIAINNIFTSLFLGLILSLISAAILKKPANPFDQSKPNNEF